ncbi:TIM-barrel domain-containing protein [Nostoc sp.]|uniref:TIM-barrel domain-containing protein n=1 Tax=Nostoc sp. TaxID=1180 RepID=UPI002FF5B5AD
MSDSISISNSHSYRFVTVEEFFADYKKWHKIEKAVSVSFNEENKTLTIGFDNIDGEVGKRCFMLLEFLRKDIFRVRFNPFKTSDRLASDRSDSYTFQNTRSVVQDTSEDLRKVLDKQEEFWIKSNQTDSYIELVTQYKSEFNSIKNIMRVVVSYNFFQIQVFNYPNWYNNSDEQGEEFKVWETEQNGIYYTFNGTEKEDYAILQVIQKPATAKYIGFGEQGGKSLCKNTAQVNYFNFDNMRYRQVYNVGPLDGREPLYHSDPFFMEFNGVPHQNSVYGIYIDNPSQILIDIGYANSSRYMYGTRFGDLDYYFFLGENAANIIDGFTSIVGRSRLKPRYALGYHQGCYGYENRKALEWVVQKYRDNNIPLDGLHIDVDVQNKYQTFTINEQEFPDPKGMFAWLKEKGIKCSTNITPIISNNDLNYQTYKEGLEKEYFVLDERHQAKETETWYYQDYDGGHEKLNKPNCPNYDDGKPFTGEVYYGNVHTQEGEKELGTSGHYPDLGILEIRKWWGKQYKYLFEMGLEFVWQDMTTPAIRNNRGDMRSFPFRLLVTNDFTSDNNPEKTPFIKMWNLFSYNLHKATYHGLNELGENFPDTLGERKNKRNFIVGRGSFTGMHRFAALWTGDNSSTWDFLKMNISQVISLGMCGMSICGQDIGGFEAANDSEKWAGPELIMRWTAAGAFLPWFRNHYMRKGRKEFQEPFQYMEWFNGNPPEPQDQYRMVLPVCKYYIELRYRLLQLFYDAMFENCLNGKPICRPMFLNDPTDKSLYNDKISFLDDQFFVGRDLLVAPILDEENKCRGKRDIYLPASSDWYCFKNNRQPLDGAVEGGTTIREFDAHLSADPNHINFIVPIYVRAGAIIPTVELEQYVGELNAKGLPNPITINIYPGETTNIPDGDEKLALHNFRKYYMYLDDGVSRSSAPPPPKKESSESDEKGKGEYRQTPSSAASKEESSGSDERGKGEYRQTPSSPALIKELPGSDKKGEGKYRQTLITHSYGYRLDHKERFIWITRIHDDYKPKEEYFFVAILHDPSELPARDVKSNIRNSSPLQSVSIDELEILPIKDGTLDERVKKLSDSEKNAWYYNENIDITFIKVFDHIPSAIEAITINIKYV